MSSRHRPLYLLFSLFLPFFLLCFTGVWTAFGRCLTSESAVLLALKQGFSSASALASWRSGTDCCGAWDGVTCDAAGRVIVLDLSNRSIHGNITASLFDLTSLERLNLSHNSFGGNPIPQLGFEKLASLTSLNLSNAGFIGQVPGGISRLEKLVSLDLSTYLLNEMPRALKLDNPDFRALIGGLTNLRELYLDGVNISAGGTEWCSAIADSVPGIQRLSLSGCSLSGPIDASLARLRSLSVLRLNQNNLSSTVPEFFGNFSSLSELRLSACGLRGSFPPNIFRLPSLAVLDVSSNPMLSGSLPEFPEDSALESLVLPYTNLSGTLPESIGKLKSLTRLELTNCSFFGPIPSSIGNLTRLVHLDLSSNRFNGGIPPVEYWADISEIVLAHNNLTGPIPSSFGNRRLSNLTMLDLRDNSLSGSIPESLFALPALQVILLGQNQLSGYLKDFSNASSLLTNLDLSSNKLQGSIPDSISKLAGLKILTLASNNFSGTLELDLLAKFRNLTTLDLSSNRLSIADGDSNSSVPFPLVTTLKLVSCNLTKIPGFLRYQNMMNSLDLSSNRIDGAIPKWMWSIGDLNLIYLNLSYNLFTDIEGPLPDLSRSPILVLDLHSNKLKGAIPIPPPNINILDYSNNYFSSSIPSNITSYLNFTLFFSLSNNSLTGEIPPSICNATFLQVLDLSYNNLSGRIPSCLLEGNSDLRVLNLRGNKFNGSLPQNFSKGCKLQTLNLNGNKFEGKVPWSLSNCDMLEVLDLGNNGMSGSFPFWLGSISALRVLVLRSNQFYGQVNPPPGIHESNHSFSMLQIFDLSSNQFNGSLPSECFGHLKAMMVASELPRPTVGFRYLEFNSQSYYQDRVSITVKGLELTYLRILAILTYIDFSNNGFDGGIPEVIGNLKSLYMLNLSQNALSGRIPSVFGNMRQLELLDLSWNNLSGEIPPELTLLTFLSYLNLSSNNLSGRIPQGSQFSTFSDSSFEGNAELCGSPLSKQCASPSLGPASMPKYAASKTVIDPNWQFIFVGLGFGGGLAMVTGPLVMWRKGRRWFNRLVDELFWSIVSIFGVCNNCGDVKVGAEDEAVEMEEEEGPGRRFCVFCTRLDFLEGKVLIHHVDCSCPLEE